MTERKIKWKRDFLNFELVIPIIIFLFIIIVISPQILGNSLVSNLFNNSTKLIEILIMVALAIGFSIYLGSIFALRKNYRFIRVGLVNKERITFYGTVFLFSIIIIILYYYYQQLLVLILIPLIGLLLYIGYINEINQIRSMQNDKVTLKMFAQDNSDNTRLKVIHNLELYQTTDTDYRFKDINDNEYIIPIGQVQEIIYHFIET